MTHLDKERSQLKQELLLMASKATHAIHNAVKAVMERDDQQAREVIAQDIALDRFEISMDELGIRLLSMAPLAKDLRFITTAMKISGELERVGDEATTVSRRALELNKEPELRPGVEVLSMARTAMEMLDDALDAFINANPEKARHVVPRDKQVDAQNKALQQELANYMTHHQDRIQTCLHWMTISKSLERVGDHAKNVAEEVVYMCEAEDIRHSQQP